MAKEYFYLEESPYENNKYIIAPKHEKCFLKGTKGSYNILAARLFNTTYANYLRMCRDEFGANIQGKNHLYPVAYFEKNEKVKKLVACLNKRAEKAELSRKDLIK